MERLHEQRCSWEMQACVQREQCAADCLVESSFPDESGRLEDSEWVYVPENVTLENQAGLLRLSMEPSTRRLFLLPHERASPFSLA